MPRVSIIIPAYNAEKYLAEAVESCLRQTHSDLEIIVVDDGSTDQTAAIVQSYSQVRYFHQPNAGPSAARNRGIQAASGAFLQFLDADDVLLPEKIARCLAEFDTHPDAGVVYTDYEVRDAALQAPATGVAKPPISVPQEQILAHLVASAVTLFQLSCALLRRSVLTEAKPFDERLRIAEDWLFWIKLARRGVKFLFLPEPLVWYRMTPASLTKAEVKVARERLHAYEILRELDLPTEFDLNGKIAGRHHALAVRLWEQGRRSEARQHFRQALAKGAGYGSRFMLAATYCTSAERATRWLQILQRLRRRR